MVSYAPDQLAGYVCNHAGPSPTVTDPTGLFPPQSEVDGLIKTVKAKSGLIACVAMEYSARGQAPGTQPFVKFFIFGANGSLLSTVDLDGRGPKGVPNVCTACHGGTFDYNTVASDGKTAYFDPSKKIYYDPTLQPTPDVPSNIRPAGDLGAHFLPFDKQNFAFSSKLSPDQQDDANFRLNVDVYTTEITRVKIGSNGFISYGGLASASITDLISNWYDSKLSRDNPAPGFDTTKVSIFCDFYGYNQIYLNSYAHSCRTCHVAMENAPLDRAPLTVKGVAGPLVFNTHTMPNAKVTFDRFWLSDPNWTFPPVNVPGQPASAPNQPSLLNQIMACVSFNNP
ncbi:MAG TPA: hypothetical protein VE690_13445 [Rhodopila sp.]|nr:hypothetical protein [Rhodopila sp.]